MVKVAVSVGDADLMDLSFVGMVSIYAGNALEKLQKNWDSKNIIKMWWKEEWTRLPMV